MIRSFDYGLLLRYLIEVKNFPIPVARKAIEDMELDGDGLILKDVLEDMDAWNRQRIKENTREV